MLSSQTNCDRTFDLFFQESVNFVSGKGYLIADANLFRQVVRTFFYYAQNEYEKILVKIESDQKSKINITEKALKEFDEMQRKQALIEREKKLNNQLDRLNGFESADNEGPVQESQIDSGNPTDSQQRKNYLSLDYVRFNEMGTNIPGFE